jgi:hypothetical protein
VIFNEMGAKEIISFPLVPPQFRTGRGKAVFVVAPSPAALPDSDRAE